MQPTGNWSSDYGVWHQIEALVNTIVRGATKFSHLQNGHFVLTSKTFNGLGHFFYVLHDGALFFDYGLDVGNYTTQVPEFGFNRHFTPLHVVYSSSPDLFLEQGHVLKIIGMARIISSIAPVQGWIAGQSSIAVIPLSWVLVRATNDTISRSAPTLDGIYDGPRAINLPGGTYNITFSVAFYQPQTVTNLPVLWVAITPCSLRKDFSAR